MVDERTHAFYEANAEEIAAQYHRIESPSARYFSEAFGAAGEERAAAARVLDLGTGPGRDLAALLAEGYDARGLEPSSALRACALKRHPELAGRLFAGALPDDLPPPEVLGAPFDGLLCSAVLQHLSPEALGGLGSALASLLGPGGRLLASLPSGRPTDAEGRDPGGRLFSGLTPEALEAWLGPAGFVRRTRHDNPDGLGRPGVSWATLVFELDP